jgi:uncharacterized protein YjdB
MINKKFAFNAIIGTVAVAAIMLFAGCLNPFEPQIAPEKAPAGKGYFAFTLDDEGRARTIQPEATQEAFIKYRLDFFIADSAGNPASDTGIPDITIFLNADDLDYNQLNRTKLIELPVGFWNLNVTAYVDFASETNDAQNRPGARGSLPKIEIKENALSIAGGKVNLYPIPDEGYGTFSWIIEYPAVTKTATMTIEPIVQWGTTPKRIYTFTDKPEDTPLGELEVRGEGSLELESGTYRVIFDLVDTEDHRLQSREILQIYRNLDSHFEKIFEEKYFIIKRVTGITLTTDPIQTTNPIQINTGLPLQLVGIVEPPDATFTDIVWSVKEQNSTGTTIDEDGILTATSATIPYSDIQVVATIEHGAGYEVSFTDEFTVRILYTNVQTISLNVTEVTLLHRDEYQLELTLTPSNASNRNLVFTPVNKADGSDDTVNSGMLDYATVNPETLKVTAVYPGTAIFKVTSTQGPSVSAIYLTVNVKPIYVTKINLNASWAFLPLTGQINLYAMFSPKDATYTDLIFASLRTDLITVGATDGIVKVSGGTVSQRATITVTSMGGDPEINGGKLEEQCIAVIVADDDSVTGVTLQTNRMLLGTGEIRKMEAVLQPENASSELYWNSSDDETVEVIGDDFDRDGTIKGLKVGEAVIVVNTMTSGRIASCLVEVYDSAGKTPVKGLTLDPAADKVAVGYDVQLNPVFTPANPTYTNVKYVSSNPAIAKVDEDTGLVTGVSPSPIVDDNPVPTIITAVSEDAGYVASFAITVVSTPVERIELNMKTTGLDMTTTKTVQLIATVYPFNATDKSLKWSSLNPNIASVDEDGIVTYKGSDQGISNTYIYVESVENPNIKQQCTVGPISGTAVGGVSLHTDKLSVAVGKSATLLATVTPDDADKTLSWHSLDDTIVTVIDGVVSPATGPKARLGTADIIVMTKNNGYTAKCTVTTYNGIMAQSLMLNTNTLTLRSGTGTEATNGRTAFLIPILIGGFGNTNEVIWKSDNDAMATVDTNGKVTGFGPYGTAIITATSVEGGYTATCTVNVQPIDITVRELRLNTNSLNLEAGETATLIPFTTPETATSVTTQWRSLDTTIAEVSAGGVVSAKATGIGKTVTIIATAVSGGFTYNCAVTVRAKGADGPAVNGVKLNTDTTKELTLVRSRGATLHAFVGPMVNGQSTAANKNIFWISSNTAVANVNQNGEVTATTTDGTATIMATTIDGGHTTQCKVTVRASSGTQVNGLNLNMQYLTLNTRTNYIYEELHTGTIKHTYVPPNANQGLIWYNSNPEVATHNEATGVVSAHTDTRQLGKTLIMVTTAEGGFVQQVEVTVVAQGTSTAPAAIQAVGSVEVSDRFFSDINKDWTITATVNPANAANRAVVWTSNNSKIQVDANGVVSGYGSATITATSVDGGIVSNECTVVIHDSVKLTDNNFVDYNMGTTQVTQGLWKLVMTPERNNISASPSYWSANPPAGEAQIARPVDSVSWYEALVFCNRMSVLVGLTPVYEMIPSTGGTTRTSDTSQWGNVPTAVDARWGAVSMVPDTSGYRIPTYDHWARAYANGGDGWTYTNSGRVTHQVGMKPPNNNGVYDIKGNVWEWLWDIYSGTNRAARGGSYNTNPPNLDVDYAGAGIPNGKERDFGFRVEREMPFQPPESVELTEKLISAGMFDMQKMGRNVMLSAFYMSAYEITQEQYVKIMRSNPSEFNANPAAGDVQGKRPVEKVSWYAALVFCNRLSEVNGYTPAYEMIPSTGGTTKTTDTTQWGSIPTANDARWNEVSIVAGSTGYRLPTEAQWEYACRAGTNTNYYWSDTGNGDYTWSTAASTSAVSNTDRTRQVGLKQPNSWGLYDMIGNVHEWCWDRYGTLSTAAINNPLLDPTGAVSGDNRITRGGSFRDGAVWVGNYEAIPGTKVGSYSYYYIWENSFFRGQLGPTTFSMRWSSGFPNWGGPYYLDMYFYCGIRPVRPVN